MSFCSNFRPDIVWRTIYLVSAWLAAFSSLHTSAADPAFENWIFIDSPPGTSGRAVSFFNGHVRQPTDPANPNNGAVFIARSAFGQSFAASTTPDSFLCDPTTGYQIWVQQHFPESVYLDPLKALTVWGMTADPDGDGLSNFLEYVFGLNPLVRDDVPELAMTFGAVNGTNRVFVTHRRRGDDPKLSYTLSASSDLMHWEPAATTLDLVSVANLSAFQQEVTYRDIVPLHPTTNRFYSLAISYQSSSSPAVDLLAAPGAGTLLISNTLSISNTITLNTQTSDPTNCVIRVDFFANGILIGQTINGNYSLQWTPKSVGTNLITAKAINSLGLATVSQPLRIFVDGDNDGDGIPNSLDPFPNLRNRPPSILALQSLSPSNFHVPTAVGVTVSASDPDGDSISFQLLMGAVPLTPVQASPLLTWPASAADLGPKTLTTQVTDRWGLPSSQSRGVFLFRSPPAP